MWSWCGVVQSNRTRSDSARLINTKAIQATTLALDMYDIARLPCDSPSASDHYNTLGLKFMDQYYDVYISSAEWEEAVGGVVTRSRCSSRSSSTDSRSQRLVSPPHTVILGLWPGARQDQINYYVDGYQSLYPSAEIILLHHSCMSTQHIEKALERLCIGYEKVANPITQDILVHLFGDYAAVQVCRLLRAYRTRTNLTLAVKSIVLDSIPVMIAPSIHSYRMTPEQLLVSVYLTLLGIFWRLASVLAFWYSEPFNDQVQRDLHDPHLLPANTRKSYIFPERDVMWAWDRPTDQEEVCERQEFGVKRWRVDQPHIWSGDQERYWLGIENAWEGK